MKVVLDANIVIADFWMRSPGFKILFENAKKGSIELYIPQVVLDEVINKYDQRIEKCQIDINSEISKFEKLSDSSAGIMLPAALISKAKAKYKRYVEKIIRDNSINVTSYPKTSHEYLAKKAMRRIKPFTSTEKGYRDNLIWENIKSLISPIELEIVATPELIFITNNHRDFAGDDNTLHPDLKSELEEENLHTDSIAIYPALVEFNDKVAKMFFTQANLFEAKLQHSEFDDFNLKSIIDDYLFKHFVGSDLHHYYSFAPYANDRPTVSTINDDYKIDKIAARKLNSKEFIVDVSFKLETEIDYFIDKSEYWSNDNVNVYVIDSDWNNHVVAVSNSITLAMEIALVINSKLECTSIEINKINDQYVDDLDDEYG